MTETAARTSANQLLPNWPVTPLVLGAPPSKPVAIKVTPVQLEAGRAAFLQRRQMLDDLYQFYEADLAGFLRAIYRAMVRAGDAR
jgi:hypothetical protein